MNNLVTQDFLKNKFTILILCIGCLPLFLDDYCRYLLALLIPVAIIKFKPTLNLVFVITFSTFYTLSFHIRGETISSSALGYYFFYPPTMYIIGYRIASRFKSLRSDILLITLLCFSLAIPAIYYNLLDFAETKILIKSSRNITFGDQNTLRNATGYGMMLSLVLALTGTMFSSAIDRFDKTLKISQLIFSLFAIFCTVRLVNRTGLVIALTSIIIANIFQGMNTKRFFKLVLIILSTFCILLIIDNSSSWLSDAIKIYDKRDHGVGSVNTYGGRSVRWLAGISQIMEYPMGAKKLLIHGYNYAHNLWLDAGIKGGILSFIVLIIITIRFIISFFKVYTGTKLSKFDKTTLLLIAVGLMMQSFTEPIIEGLPVFFWIWIFYWGMLDRIGLKNIEKYHT